MQKTWRRYSEAFQRQVVEELSCGKHASFEAARRAYGIRGASTVMRWARKHGRADLAPQYVRIETMKERDEKAELRARVRDLERAVADAHMDYSLEKAYLQVACERLGEDLDGFKKKHAMTLSATRKKPAGTGR